MKLQTAIKLLNKEGFLIIRQNNVIYAEKGEKVISFFTQKNEIYGIRIRIYEEYDDEITGHYPGTFCHTLTYALKIFNRL